MIEGRDCTIPSEIANTEDGVKNWIKGTWLPGIDGLEDSLKAEYANTTIEQLTIEPQERLAGESPAFIPAVGGTVDKVNGIGGRYLFEINLPNGTTIAKTGCIIEPQKYVAPVMAAPTIAATGTSVVQNDGEVTVNQGNKVTLTASLPENAATHTLQWREKSEGADKWNVISNATGSSIETTTDDSNVHKQYLCTAIYGAETNKYESDPVSILINPKMTIAAKGTNDAGTYEITARGHGFEAGTILNIRLCIMMIEDVTYAVKAGLPNANNAEVKDVEVWNGEALRTSRPEYGGIKDGEILEINGSKYFAMITRGDSVLVWMGGEKDSNIRLKNEEWTWIPEDHKYYGLDTFKILMDKAGEFVQIDGVTYQYGPGVPTQPERYYIYKDGEAAGVTRLSQIYFFPGMHPDDFNKSDAPVYQAVSNNQTYPVYGIYASDITPTYNGNPVTIGDEGDVSLKAELNNSMTGTAVFMHKDGDLYDPVAAPFNGTKVDMTLTGVKFSPYMLFVIGEPMAPVMSRKVELKVEEPETTPTTEPAPETQPTITSGTEAAKKNAASVNTGDDRPLMLWGILLVVSIVCMGSILVVHFHKAER